MNVILLRIRLWPVQTPELNTVMILAHQCKNLTFYLIQHILIARQCGESGAEGEIVKDGEGL